MNHKLSVGVRLLVDCASLERSNSGAIWGRICLEVADRFFPDAGWTDIAVVICVAWLEGLRRIASGEIITGRVYFMDGPFRVDLKRASREAIELSLVNFRKDEVVEHRSEETIRLLLRNAVACGQSVLNSSNEHDWGKKDHDIQSLRSAVSAANSLLSSWLT
jgi:hypothetical protein